MKTDKTNYLIMELNAKNMVTYWKDSSQDATYDINFEFHLKFFLPEYRKRYINVIDRFDSCPLFDQIEYICQTDSFNEYAKSRFITKLPRHNSDDYIEISDNKKIDKSLIFMDCTGVIKQKKTDIFGHPIEEEESEEETILRLKTESLFTSGISVDYGDEVVHYVPFDKSNSMSKKNKISFIDARLYEALNKRLLFDIDFIKSKYQLVLSKFFAYKGLYMSSSVRVDRNLLLSDAQKFQENKNISEPLNATLSRKIIVINEKIWNVNCSDLVFYSNTSDDRQLFSNEDREDHFQHCTKDTYIIDSLFDGEGIISPAYASLINQSLNKGSLDAHNATSFQIRMPFTKGMLHQVDFKDFLNSYVQNVKRDEPIYIHDYFGIRRDLREAEIIMPSSMFKWGSWLKDILTDVDDPMQYYFDKFIQYSHSMYIANTDNILGNKKYTSLNYQFLNTLKLAPDNLKILLDSHVKKAMDPYSYLKDMSTTDIDEDGNPIFNELSASMAALLKNRIFEHQKKIDADLKATSNSLIVDLALGKIIVDGEIRFLSRDLLFFLTNLLYLNAKYLKNNLHKNNDKSEEYILKCKNHINELKATSDKIYRENALHSWTFYMAGSKIELDSNRYYSIFRSPHLSRNEQCALKPYTNKIYDRYFSHLSGVIMLSSNSLDPLALGGADFDGDFVKIISNELVTQAVLDGAYEMKSDRNKSYYVRKLPIVDIIAQKSNKYKIPDTTHPRFLSIIRDTFDSKVGSISNAAIKLGQVQYGYNYDSVEPKMPVKCQDCTIITGLEIDAAKTGYHPNTNIDCHELKLAFDYIGDFKKKLDKLRSDSHFHFTKTPDEMIAIKSYTIKRRNEDYIIYNGNIIENNLSYLPMYFFDNIGRYKAPKNADTSGYIYFPFMCKAVLDEAGNLVTKYDRTWKKSIDKDFHQNIASIVCAYQELTEYISRLNRYVDYCIRNNTMAHIRHILNYQYDNKLTIDYIAENTLPQAYAIIEKRITDNVTDDCSFNSIINELIKNIRENGWAFQLDSQKDDFFRKLFNINANEEDMSFSHALGFPASSDDNTSFDRHTFASVAKNFSIQGYNLLYLILLDIQSDHAEFMKLSSTVSSSDVMKDIISYNSANQDDESEENSFINTDFYKNKLFT